MQDIIISFLQFIDPDDFVEIYIDGCDNYEFDLSEESIGYDFMKISPKKMINTMMTGTERIKIYYRIQGDKNFFQISAASIVAKVIRDRMMCDFHEDFPLY
jgi:ribonuclease HII